MESDRFRFQNRHLLGILPINRESRNEIPHPMAAFRSPAFSFRTILFLIAIAGVLPAIVFSGLLLKRFADNERSRAERGLLDSTRAIARGVDSQFATAEATV